MMTATAPTVAPEPVAQLAHNELARLADKIDQEGFYPQEFLRALGEQGGFGAPVNPQTQNEPWVGLSRQLSALVTVGRYCGSTAFLVWCQGACAWYLQQSPVAATRARYLERVASGELLAGTGMSNAVKHLAGIERIHLQARQSADGYVVRGVLPWISNVGPEHLLMVAAAVDSGGYVMLAVEANAKNLRLRACPAFSGMEGTATHGVQFRDVSVAADQVVASPEQFPAFMARIKPGFLIGQSGMGLGVTDGCLHTIRKGNLAHAHVNQFLDNQEPELQAERDRLYSQALQLAALAQVGDAPVLDALKLRAAVSELTLRAANSAVLHAGARGYLMNDPAQRQLREAVFVGIVTPALKHLRKEIHDLESTPACA